MFKKVVKSEKGIAMTEYIIILALVAIAAITVITVFGKRITDMFDSATGELNKVKVAPTPSSQQQTTTP